MPASERTSALEADAVGEASPGARLREEIDRLAAGVRRRFTVDTRALAALRIALGLIILVDLVHRWPHIQQFYTDAGVYPLSTYEATYSYYTGVSLHALSGELWVQQLLFVLAGVLALALVLGYRSRWAALASLVLLLSLHARNPVVLNGGDRLLRVLLFVALLVPLGERWSIDALRRGSARESIASLGTVAVLAQPLVVFTANAIKKHRGDTWFEGEALELALNNDVMTYHLGNLLGDHVPLLVAMNYGWLALLAGSIVFLWVTVGRLRALAALLYMGAFAGMLVTLSVGLFPLVLAASLIAFLTPPVWDALEDRVPASWRRRWPSRASLGPLARPHAERRWLARLRETGRGSTVDAIVRSGRAFASLAGVLVIVWMVGFTASNVADAEPPEPLDHGLLDQQRWGLYAPGPSTAYSWPVVEAKLGTGANVSALDDTPLSFDRPDDASQVFDTFRHRKHWETLRRSAAGSPGPIAEAYADWACDRAREIHGPTVTEIAIHRLYQRTPVDGEVEDLRTFTLMRHACRPA